MKQTIYFFQNNRTLSLVILMLMVLSPAGLFAQVSEGGAPYSFTHQLRTEAAEIVLPQVDVARLEAEDKIEAEKGLPYRFGYPHEVSYSMKNSGTWEELPDGARIWRLKITCPNAKSINLVYREYLIPDGAKLYLYNESRTEVIGAFTKRNCNPDGLFATGILRGQTIYLEYYLPAHSVNEGIIDISHIVHGYKDIFAEHQPGEDFGGSGSCNINVNCPQGADWQNQKRGVAMILTASNSRLCTGMMINNVRQDLTPYFLTANHCISAGTPTTWIFMFRYESPNCTNIDGPLNYTVSGSTVKAKNAASDFGLLLLNTAVPDSYRVHYLGWSTSDVPPTSGVGIHHPSGDIKKISFVTQPFEHDTWSGTPASSHWRTRWSAGVTEPGSSGSPIFDQNHRVVGQLHGGPSSCTATDKSDLYGKTSMSWNYGTTPATRLKDWLDPDNTGATFLDGWDPTMGTRDTIPPTRVTDLHTLSNTSNSITIGWTAPFDTSYGGVTKYNLRYSTTPITDTITFAAATAIPTGSPKPAGQAEQLEIKNLTPGTTYYFALRSADLWNNWSLLSNINSSATMAAPTVLVTPDSLKKTLLPQMVVTDSIMVKNNSSYPSTLDYTVELVNNTFPGKVSLQLVPVNNESAENVQDKNNPQEHFGQSIEGSGGPDSAGYKWIDSDEPNGPAYVWEDISTTGTAVTNWVATGTFAALDEGYAGPFPLGFNFKFYRQTKTDIYISSNGILVFAAPTSNIFTNAAIPTATAPNEYIAPFWDDLDGRTQGTVHVKQDGNRFIIQYTNWQKYSGTGSLTFQVVLYSGGKIMYYYNNMNATLNSATVGTENATGTTGLQVAYNATYVKNNLAVKISAEPDWVNTTNLGGTLYNGNTAAVRLTFRSEDFPAGNYSMDLKVKSNDPTTPVKTIPIKMTLNNPLLPITVTAPNGGETWQVGATKNITWNSDGVTNVAIKYSTNSGTSWTPIVASVPAASGTYAWTVPATPSTQCKVRISNADADTTFDVSDNVFTISAGLITWQSPMTVKDYGNLSQALAFGTASTATNGIDVGLGEVSLPPSPPAGNFDARFELPVTPAEFSYKDYRRDTLQSASWIVKFQPGASGYPMTFTWTPAALPAGNFTLKDVVTGTIVNIDMKANSTYTLTNTGVTQLKIEYTQQLSVPMAIAAGWNMVSVPVQAADMGATAIFSGANSYVFGYNNGYVTMTTLEVGKGYWVRYPAAANFNLSGNPVSVTTVPLMAGWNMVGPYHNNATVANITTTPANIINSYFFGFNNGYQQATTLEKGKGYWVRASAAGVMNLPASEVAKAGEGISIEKSWTKIIVTDAAGQSMTLYALPTAQNGFDLPPVPPTGIFDVRFDGDKFADVISSAKDIRISGAMYPVTVRVEGASISLRDKATAGKLLNQTITSGQSATIANSGVNTIEVTSSSKPTTFALAQNYPNPFNPSTVISYQIPVNGLVTLKVYDAIGTEVATLVNSHQESGSYNVTFDASKLNSGVYFYTLRSGDFSATKKLLLVK